MTPLLECVPNFSEGRDEETLDGIRRAVQSVEGVHLLGVDAGRATNRTVVTFVGAPEAVVEAAVRTARVAAERIDMRRHQGEHPRFGGLDVCPLVPVSGITMEETIAWAHRLARRLGEEVGLTVFCYERAATRPERRSLADVRAGEYEGLEKRLADPAWAPDYGPRAFSARTGATAVGARDFLVAFNANLNTTSTRRANAIAFDVRERGRVKRDPPLTGAVVKDAKGQPVWEPGSLRAVKAIGWYIEEYGICQISMNLTDLSITPVHVAFEEVCRRAEARGVRVTGAELVGLVPLRAMLDAGRYFLEKQHRSIGVSDRELVRIAVRSMGLGELEPFEAEQRIVEYAIRDRGARRLADLTLGDFVETTASEAPAPGGGSVSAAVGALGAALGAMVANLSAHRRGWDDRWREFSDLAERGKACWAELVDLVDEDTRAFEGIVAAWKAPAEERSAAIQRATTRAIEVPLRVMEVAVASFDVLDLVAERGLGASISDVGVGGLAARTAVLGAELNVRINAQGLKDVAARDGFLERAAVLRREALRREAALLEVVDRRLEKR